MDWDTITFDCYGTLVDWETGIVEAFAGAAKADGIGVSAGAVLAAYHEVEPRIQRGTYRRYREVLRDTALEIAQRFDWSLPPERAEFLADSLPDWPVFDDTRPALERLKARYKLAILSNIDEDLLAGTLERVGVEFDWTLTAEQTRSYKPAHGHFREALSRLGSDSDRWLHVAQSYFHDIRPARDLGVSAVWVNRKDEARPGGPAPVHVVRDLQGLADWLGA